MRINYKIKVKETFGTNSGKPILGVSLSNPIFNGGRCSSLANWMNATYSEVTLIVGDHLNRHNYQRMNVATTGEAYQRSITQAKEILQTITDSLNEPRSIRYISTRIYYDNPAFNNYLKAIEKFMRENPKVDLLVDEDIQAMLNRTHVSPSQMHDLRAASKKYVYEELAIFALMVESGYSRLIYPGRQLSVLCKFATGELAAPLPALNQIELIHLKLTRRKS